MLFFDRRSLLYDIAMAAHIEADVRPEEEEHAKHMQHDIVEDGNRDIITRQLDLAHKVAVDLLHPLTKTEASDGETRDDFLYEDDTYRIRLSVPTDFAKNSLTLLEKLVHEYLVATAMAHYSALIAAPNAAYWQQRHDDLEGRVKKAANKATGARRRRLCPF